MPHAIEHFRIPFSKRHHHHLCHIIKLSRELDIDTYLLDTYLQHNINLSQSQKGTTMHVRQLKFTCGAHHMPHGMNRLTLAKPHP